MRFCGEWVRPAVGFVLALALGACAPEVKQPTEGSQLWGRAGELWDPRGRLPDFSYAGYRSGEETIPDFPVAVNVRDHGATGDGVTDDTAAIQAAIAAAGEGAVFLPAGRYVVTERIQIVDRSNLVIRGGGPEETILVFPRSLEEAEGAELQPRVSRPLSRYSFSGGFLEVTGNDPGSEIGPITAPSRRGDLELLVSDDHGIRPGDLIRVRLPALPAVADHLYAGLAEPGSRVLAREHLVDWTARVVAVDGRRLRLDRPLRTDLLPEWNPVLSVSRPTTTNCGIEDLAFVFAGRPKREHLQEEGFNAIQFDGVVDCWVRNVRIVDADLGVILTMSRNCTVSGVRLEQDRRTGVVWNGTEGITGHHGLKVSSYSQDNLLEDFVLATRFHHDLAIEGFANGNVFRAGRGTALNFDHHGKAPFANLFTNLEAGDGSHLWESGGASALLPHTGARATFWNIRWDSGWLNFKKRTDESFPVDWPLVNVVGVRGTPDVREERGPWVEPLEEGVEPEDLYLAQRARRLH